MNSLWMSSISNDPAVLLTNTAFVKDVRWPVPHSEATPLPPSSRTTSKIFRVPRQHGTVETHAEPVEKAQFDAVDDTGRFSLPPGLAFSFTAQSTPAASAARFFAPLA